MNMRWNYTNDLDGLWPDHLELSKYLQRQYAEFVRENVIYPVLEIGAGTGWLGDFLTEGYYLGLDLSLSAVQIANYKKRNIAERNFMTWDNHGMEINTVVSIATVMYQKDLLESFRKIRSVLSNKGRYVFIERFTDRHHDEGVVKVNRDRAEQLLCQVFSEVKMWHFDVNFLRYLILKKGFPDCICKLEPVLRKLKLPSWYYMGVCRK